jgi:hypothetical protein
MNSIRLSGIANTPVWEVKASSMEAASQTRRLSAFLNKLFFLTLQPRFICGQVLFGKGLSGEIAGAAGTKKKIIAVSGI